MHFLDMHKKSGIYTLSFRSFRIIIVYVKFEKIILFLEKKWSSMFIIYIKLQCFIINNESEKAFETECNIFFVLEKICMSIK